MAWWEKFEAREALADEFKRYVDSGWKVGAPPDDGKSYIAAWGGERPRIVSRGWTDGREILPDPHFHMAIPFPHDHWKRNGE